MSASDPRLRRAIAAAQAEGLEVAAFELRPKSIRVEIRGPADGSPAATIERTYEDLKRKEEQSRWPTSSQASTASEPS